MTTTNPSAKVPTRAAARNIMPAVRDLVVHATNGITTSEVAAKLGRSPDSVRRALSALGNAGDVRVLRFGAGQDPRWYRPDVAAAVRAQLAEEAKRRRREQNRVHGAAAWARRKQAEAEEAAYEEEVELPAFVHRWASADAPLPFVCRAPASVFHFGAAGGA